MQQSNAAKRVFDQCAAAFNPIAAVVMSHAAQFANFGFMNMTAHHAAALLIASLKRKRALKAVDIANSVFDLLL